MQKLLNQLSGRYGIALFSYLGAAELQVSMETALDALCGLSSAPALKRPQAAYGHLAGLLASMLCGLGVHCKFESGWKCCKA